MTAKSDAIAYRPFLNRDRLIYITHSDAGVAKEVCDAFVTQGFQVSIVPDVETLDRMAGLRRPDLAVMPIEVDQDGLRQTLDALSALRSRHLGIHTFLLAPPEIRAETVVLAIRNGASVVFSPPYQMLDIVRAAEELFRADLRLETRDDGAEEVTVRGFGTLTHREREVLQHVVGGRTNKEIAVELGLSYRTVEVHRRHIMAKIGARNTAELVRLAIET